MDEKLKQEFLSQIKAELDPMRRSQLMSDMTLAMSLGKDPLADASYSTAPADALNVPSIPAPTDPALITPTDVATRTVGDFKNPYAGMTAEQFLAAMQSQDAALAQSAAAAAQDGRDDPARFLYRPTVDLNQEMFGMEASQLASESILMRSNMLKSLEEEIANNMQEANLYRTGQKRVQRSGITDKLEIATTPEDFARIKASGKIPIAARDAKVIIENARREADALLRSGEAGVATAAINRTQIAGNQIATGLGSGLASALTGVNVGGENLSAIRSQAENARQQLLDAIQQRRSTQVGAESLNSRARIDSMIAQLEPMQAISQLIQADEMDFAQRQIQAEKEAAARAEQARLRLENIQLQEPQFKANLLTFAQMARTPIPGEFAQFPTPRGGSGMDPMAVNQSLDAAITNAAKELQAQLDVIKGTDDIWVNEGETTEAINRIISQTDDIVNLVNQYKAGRVQIHPMVAAKLDALVNLKSQTVFAERKGKSLFTMDETSQLDDLYKDPNSQLTQSLEFITKTPIFGAASSGSPATGPRKKPDFSGF